MKKTFSSMIMKAEDKAGNLAYAAQGSLDERLETTLPLQGPSAKVIDEVCRQLKYS